MAKHSLEAGSSIGVAGDAEIDLTDRLEGLAVRPRRRRLQT